MFTGWTPDAPAFLAELAADHTSFDAERHRASVLTPMQALAAELASEFGELRVFRARGCSTPGSCGDPAAVDDELAGLLDGLEVDTARRLTGRPRGVPADHPHLDLLQLRGLQVGWSWPVGEWLGTPEPLERVRSAWRAAGPLLTWLDTHVGPADPVPPRPRPAEAVAIEPVAVAVVAADRTE